MAGQQNSPGRAIAMTVLAVTNIVDGTTYFLPLSSDSVALRDARDQTLRCLKGAVTGLRYCLHRPGSDFHAQVVRFLADPTQQNVQDVLLPAVWAYEQQLEQGKAKMVIASDALVGRGVVKMIEANRMQALKGDGVKNKLKAAGIYGGGALALAIGVAIAVDVCTTGGLITVASSAVAGIASAAVATGAVTGGALFMAGTTSYTRDRSVVLDKMAACTKVKDDMFQKLLSCTRAMISGKQAFEELLGFCAVVKQKCNAGDVAAVVSALTTDGRTPHPFVMNMPQLLELDTLMINGLDKYQELQEGDVPHASDAETLHDPICKLPAGGFGRQKGGHLNISVLNRTKHHICVKLETSRVHRFAQGWIGENDTYVRGVWAWPGYRLSVVIEGKESRKVVVDSNTDWIVYWSNTLQTYEIVDRRKLQQWL